MNVAIKYATANGAIVIGAKNIKALIKGFDLVFNFFRQFLIYLPYVCQPEAADQSLQR